MAQIQTYPRKTTYDADDLILICDKTPDANGIITNDTKTTTISTIADNLNVVETLNSLKGDVSITGGTNITVTPSGQNIEISTSSSNVDGSGTTGTIPKWSDSNTLTDSPFTIDTSINSLDIPTFIRHIGDTDSQFGFQADNHFRVQTGGQTTIQSISRTDGNNFTGQVAGLYYDSSQRLFTRSEGVEVEGSIFMPGYIKHLGDNDSLFGFSAPNNFIIDTDSGTKIAAGPSGVTLYSDTSETATTTSVQRFATTTTGVIVYGQTVAAGAASERGGIVRYYNNANNRFVGISGPVTEGTNYQIRLPDSVGTAGQVLKLNNPIVSGQTQDLVWGDAGSGSGDTYTLGVGTKSGSTIPLNLDATSGSDSTVDLTEGTGVSLTKGAGDEIIINTTNTLAAGNGVKIGSGTIQTDNLANGGIVYKGVDNELAIDLSATGISGTLAPIDGGTGLTNTNPATYSALMGDGSTTYKESKNIDTALKLPVGATNRRPAANEVNLGLIRYNSATAEVEVCKQTTSSSGVYKWYTIDVTIIPS